MITVTAYSPDWPAQFEVVKEDLEAALRAVPIIGIEHVGSTAVPGLAAKPVLDVDVVVAAPHLRAAVDALQHVGYRHRGDLGVHGREAFSAPDDSPVRNVYVCVEGSLAVRNHLAVREVLRSRPDLRDAYAEVKVRLAEDADLSIDRYLDGKSDILQRVLEVADLADHERLAILRLNAPKRFDRPGSEDGGCAPEGLRSAARRSSWPGCGRRRRGPCSRRPPS